MTQLQESKNSVYKSISLLCESVLYFSPQRWPVYVESHSLSFFSLLPFCAGIVPMAMPSRQDSAHLHGSLSMPCVHILATFADLSQAAQMQLIESRSGQFPTTLGCLMVFITC